jgi:hypothetical protein
MKVCTIEGCGNEHRARGWCVKHYYRWKRQGSAEARPQRTCLIEGCGRKHYGNDLCVMHHARWKKHGDPLALVKMRRSGICELDDCEKSSPGQRYCPMHLERLKRNGNFERQNRTRHVHSQGYSMVKADGHPLAQMAGWAYEHRLVLLDKIGPGEHPCNWCGTTVTWERSYPEHLDALVTDHLDEVKDNNDPANLVPSCAPCNFQRSNRWRKRASA